MIKTITLMEPSRSLLFLQVLDKSWLTSVVKNSAFTASYKSTRTSRNKSCSLTNLWSVKLPPYLNNRTQQTYSRSNLNGVIKLTLLWHISWKPLKIKKQLWKVLRIRMIKYHKCQDCRRVFLAKLSFDEKNKLRDTRLY